ncbi:hypothetical protein [Sutcliffiella horikoshii]|uniref:hypothetical protein n=1 Tax=Sutcliffiella horikoshii TaxID=79883 RepID=UPI001F1FAEEB|nr:hypothetical protein [Sutcliffiella horikoshii]MCG1020787.1 hypothetical protein [Sutcliffiella horikoshii]
MKKLSGTPKKCYKYALTAVFIQYCFGRNLTRGQEENYSYVHSIKENPKDFNNTEILIKFKNLVEESLEKSNFHNHTDYGTIDKIINYFREIVSITKKEGTCLINVSEAEEFFDVKKVFRASHPNIQSHHWIDVDFINGMTITVPEFFTYADLVNIWNILLDKMEEYNIAVNGDERIPLIERRNKIENRRLKYEIDTLSRTLWVSSVTFVESYLYFLFYNLKQQNYQAQTEKAQSILKLQKVEDDEIIKRLVLPEFINGKNNALEKLIKSYKVKNEMRNRFIHPSAFRSTSNSPELLPLLTINVDEVIDTLTVCTNLVKTIDDNLPEEYKILIWWDRVSHPEYSEYKKGDITNPQSKLSKIKYDS